MADIFETAKRSDAMSLIKGRDNKATELKLIAIFKEQGVINWRRHWPLMGKPDFVFRAINLAIFVDGCFWHGCPKHMTWPKNNAEFWRGKIERNMERDREVNRALKRKGWRVFRIWEHELKLKNRKRLLYRFRRIGLLE